MDRKQTQVLKVDPRSPSAADLMAAAQMLREGGLVAFPTETVYGLGADATNEGAIRAVFEAKGRPSDNPMIVHLAHGDEAAPLVTEVPEMAQTLMERFWPGPLTLVLPRSARVPDIVSAGLPTVALRVPAHPVAHELIRLAGLPVAAPSANLSGRPSPTSAQHVLDDLTGRIDMVVDGGEAGVGVESTVLDLSVDPPVLLRPGGVTYEQICATIGPVVLDPAVGGTADTEQPRSPGMKYRHYAPQAELIVVEGDLQRVIETIRILIQEYQQEGRRVGVMASHENRGAYPAQVVLECGSRQSPEMMAASLFACLRAFDRYRVDVIVAEGIPEEGIGLAVMNRLRKAAGGRVIRV